MKYPEQYRIDGKPGMEGAFIIPSKKRVKGNRLYFQVIASDGLDWEHVSVTALNKKLFFVKQTPTWSEMCYLKNMFWDQTETVMQLHPSVDEYVNNHHYCLHMWRPTKVEIPIPPSELVGIKGV